MKKLLLGSALAASVLLAGSSFAETKISGYLETTYSSRSTTTTGTPDNSGPGNIGHETGLYLKTSKDLDNGLGMSAGFGIVDGVNEDQFLTLSSGNTSFSVGNDVSGVADNVSHEDFTPNVAQDIHLTSVGGVADIETVHGSNGLYLKHKTDMLTLEGVYVPTVNADAATQASVSSEAAGSGYDLAVHGNFGIEGLKVGYGVSERQADSASVADSDIEGKGMGIMYSINGLTVGVGKVTNTESAIDTENTSYGISYQVNDQITVAVTGGQQEKDGTAHDTDYLTYQIGYDFGGLGITAGWYTVENSGYVSGADQDMLEIRTVTKF